jgi:hypothetical protein
MRLRATKLAAIGFGGARSSQPSLDLQFATDKTLTARKGPTPVFTRASGATQVNAAGLIEYAPENLILFSNSVTSPAWAKEGGTAATSAETVNGLTATVFNENSANSTHRFYRLNEGLAGISSTFSVWLKAAGRRYVCVNLGANGPTVNSKPVIDLVDRVVVVAAAGVTINIQLEANGWARYSFTFVPRIDSGSMPIQSNFSSTAISETGVGLNGAAFYVAGQQYERFSSARTYLPTTTSATYSPRFDHDPVTLTCKGLLIEDAKFNLITNSGNPTLWTFSGTNGGSLTAPDGSSSGLRAGIGSTTMSTSSVSSVAGTAYTISVFIKRDNTNWFRLQLNHATNANQVNAWFNLSTGTAGTVSVGAGVVTSISSSITPFGNGWYRCTVTGTVATIGSLIGNIISATADSSVSRVAGSIFGVWGGQIEESTFATSYIPTASTALSRSVDVCSITGSDFTSFNSTAGFTALCNFSFLATSTAGAMAPIAVNQSAANGVFLYKGITSSDISVYHVSANTSIGSITANFTNKAAMAYDGDSVVGVLSGGAVSVETGSTALSFTGMTIGSNRSSAHQMSGHIASIRYFKKRLPNVKLQSLTL